MIDPQAVPPYVYEEHSDPSLAQGDILKVDGEFRQLFKKFYPSIDHADHFNKHVMVTTQSCDLVRYGKRKPKLPHVNVCLVRPLSTIIEKKIIQGELQPTVLGETRVLLEEEIVFLKERLYKLLNNTDQKVFFFLPKKHPFDEDMVALLHLSYSFRIDHYDALLENRILSLKPEFQAKVGHLLAQLYGRIGTSDLFDHEWTDKMIRTYVNAQVDALDIVQIPDLHSLSYVQKHFSDDRSDISALVKEHKALQLEKQLKPARNEFQQNMKKRLMDFFDDKEQVSALMNMNQKERSKFLKNLTKLDN